MAHAVSVTVIDERIHARTPFALKDVCKSIAGRKWEKELKTWSWEATPDNALDIDTTFRQFASASVQADDAFVELLRRAHAQREEVAEKRRALEGDLEQPARRKLDQWRHQLEGYHFAYDRRGSMLAMGMGCGKTKTTLDLMENWDCAKVLILSPLEVVNVWPREFDKHAVRGFEVIPLGQRKMRVDQKAARARKAIDLAGQMRRPVAIVTNYESAWRPVFERLLLKEKWDLLVCDECHKLKAPTGKASRFVAKLSRRADRVLGLTGTPMSQSPVDIFGQARFLDPSAFGTSVTAFKHKFFSFGEHNQVTGFQGPKAREEFIERVARFTYQVSRDVLDLPEVMDEIVPVELSKDAATSYAMLAEEFITEVRGEIVTAANALVKLLRLQQITGGFVHVDADEETDTAKRIRDLCDSKRRAAAELIEGMGEEPVVVFCRFQHDLDLVADAARLAGATCVELSGRRKELPQWQEGRAQVLAVQIQAGGVGIDLTRARYCIYWSKGFSLTDYDQSRARVHRPGQERPVTYYHLLSVIRRQDKDGETILVPTIDQHVHDALQNKQDAVTAILEDVKAMR